MEPQKEQGEQKPDLKIKVGEMADKLGIDARNNLYIKDVGDFMAANSDAILNHVIPALITEHPDDIADAVKNLRFTAKANEVDLGTPSDEASKDPVTLIQLLGFYATRKTQLPVVETRIPDVYGNMSISVAKLVEKTVTEMVDERKASQTTT